MSVAKTKSNVKKDPLVHLTRLPDPKVRHYWFSKLISVVVALLMCAIITTILSPNSFVLFFKYLGVGNFSNKLQILRLFQDTAILLLIALALTPAFKMKFWNIGGEGQTLMGALGAVICLKYFTGTLPNVLLIFACLAFALVFSIVWAVVPAIFKAFFKTNETLFTLMMNYLATFIVSYFIYLWYPKDRKIGILNEVSQEGWLPKLFGQNYLLNIIIVAVVTVLVFVYLRYSKHGYELTVVGESQNTARYVGINVKKTIIRTLVLSGALCGLAGFLLVNGTMPTIDPNSTVGGAGFTAILVAWLGHFNPFEMIFTAFLVSFITLGGEHVGDMLIGSGESYSKVLIGVFFFVFIASEFFLRYKINFSSEAQDFFGKIRDFFVKVFGAIGRFFKKIGLAIANFFKKLFKKKEPSKEDSEGKEE